MSAQLHSYYLSCLGIQQWISRDALNNLTESADIEHAAGVKLGSSENNQDKDWQSLQNEVSTCKACELHKGRTQTVFGVGNKEANILIVGEAPGYHEDQQGKPFVGRAGQLLDAMLQIIGFDRTSVYIANVLKCRPPNNRDPLPAEVKQCTSFLNRQIALMKPKLILAVGRHAAHHLLNTKESLARLRGCLHYYGEEKIPLIASSHPAYLLRKPIDKRKAFIDLCRVKDQHDRL